MSRQTEKTTNPKERRSLTHRYLAVSLALSFHVRRAKVHLPTHSQGIQSRRFLRFREPKVLNLRSPRRAGQTLKCGHPVGTLGIARSGQDGTGDASPPLFAGREGSVCPSPNNPPFSAATATSDLALASLSLITAPGIFRRRGRKLGERPP